MLEQEPAAESTEAAEETTAEETTSEEVLAEEAEAEEEIPVEYERQGEQVITVDDIVIEGLDEWKTFWTGEKFTGPFFLYFLKFYWKIINLSTVFTGKTVEFFLPIFQKVTKKWEFFG